MKINKATTITATTLFSSGLGNMLCVVHEGGKMAVRQFKKKCEQKKKKIESVDTLRKKSIQQSVIFVISF